MTDELQTVMSQAGNIDGLKAIFDECLPEFYAAVLIFIVKATKYFGSRTGVFLESYSARP